MSEPGPHSLPDEAMVDLLVKQVTEGLSPAEQRALDVLDGAVASSYLRDFECAAAAVTLVGSAGARPPPPMLRARLERQAEAWFTTAATQPRTVVRRGTPGWFAAGWWAAAASLVLAVFGWWRSLPPSRVAPPAQARAGLLTQTAALKLNWAATKDPAALGVSGDVVWDPVTQQGFMRFVGLPANDPRVQQYQLWIFDGARDSRYPVDGGVFDVPANGAEVLIAIHAALPVRIAKAFAVTLEKPGGVVVSGRERVLVLGQAG